MGVIHSQLTQILPPKPTFTPDNIPDLSGRIMIVTGANAGIGKETAKALLSHNAKVYFACRDEVKALAAISELREITGGKGIFLRLDLADIHSVKAAAETFMSQEKALHVLFNSGGVMVCPLEATTAQSYDQQFGVNVLGHYYFTKLLLPALAAGSNTSPDGHSRVVTTSSSAHDLTNNINFDTLKGNSPSRKQVGKFGLYAQSKLGNVIVSTEFSKRYHDQGIVFTSLNPGNIKTELQRHLRPIEASLLNLMLYDVSYGALTQLYAGTAPEAVELNGKYLIPWARLAQPNPVSQDPKLGGELWTWLEEQVKDL